MMTTNLLVATLKDSADFRRSMAEKFPMLAEGTHPGR